MSSLNIIWPSPIHQRKNMIFYTIYSHWCICFSNSTFIVTWCCCCCCCLKKIVRETCCCLPFLSGFDCFSSHAFSHSIIRLSLSLSIAGMQINIICGHNQSFGFHFFPLFSSFPVLFTSLVCFFFVLIYLTFFSVWISSFFLFHFVCFVLSLVSHCLTFLNQARARRRLDQVRPSMACWVGRPAIVVK